MLSRELARLGILQQVRSQTRERGFCNDTKSAKTKQECPRWSFGVPCWSCGLLFHLQQCDAEVASGASYANLVDAE